MTKKEILEQAKALIEKGWCKGENARDRDGRACGVSDADAAQFCILGSLSRVEINHGYEFNTYGARCKIAAVLEDKSYQIPEFNDDPKTTKDMVLGVFDTAIAGCAP